MLIGTKYKIESDSMNVTVSEKFVIQGGKGGKSSERVGEVVYRPIAYFSSVKNALLWLIEHRVAMTALKDLKTVVDEIQVAKKEVLQALKHYPEVTKS